MTTANAFPDGLKRCAWVDGSPEYMAYHDQEWGHPVSNEQVLFEQLCLEGFQAGLSWRTILLKRPAFRQAFAGFDAEKVARFGPEQVAVLLGNAGIVRHRGKIEAVIKNARCALEARERDGSLGALLWRYEAPRPRPAKPVVATTPESDALSKELKKRGWSFVGSTTIHAFMQAVGMVNDHSRQCHMHAACDAERKTFKRPGA